MKNPSKAVNEQVSSTASAGQLPEKGRSLKGTLLLLTAFIACPCHLPLTLALLGGTALGLFLTKNLLWVVPLLGIYFMWALFKGLKVLR